MATPAQLKRLDRTGLAAAKRLEQATSAMNSYMSACRDVGQGPQAADDGRLRLVEDMSEYSTFLAMRHAKKGGA